MKRVEKYDKRGGGWAGESYLLKTNSGSRTFGTTLCKEERDNDHTVPEPAEPTLKDSLSPMPMPPMSTKCPDMRTGHEAGVTIDCSFDCAIELPPECYICQLSSHSILCYLLLPHVRDR